MPTYEPSLKIVHAFLDPETRKSLPLPLVALITGALSQVETTIELTNRVCDSVSPFNRDGDRLGDWSTVGPNQANVAIAICFVATVCELRNPWETEWLPPRPLSDNPECEMSRCVRQQLVHPRWLPCSFAPRFLRDRQIQA
jgi:hypothetical protein